MLCNIFDTYVNYHRRWSSYINKYPHTRPIYHEDMLEQKEDYLSPILKDSGIHVDKDKLKKCFDKYSTKKSHIKSSYRRTRKSKSRKSHDSIFGARLRRKIRKILR